MMNQRYLHPEAGIAIGPILFIIAILAVLAAAIAAGSGGFTGGTTQESTKTKATAIIQMGQNLKLGWDRITANGIDPASIIIDPAFTSAGNHMFSPSGGGITPPSNVFAEDGYEWFYHVELTGSYPGLYSAAVLAISDDVCQETNRQLFGASLLPNTPGAVLALIQPNSIDDSAVIWDIATTSWPTGVPRGQMAFCAIGEDNLGNPQAFFIQYFVL